MKSVNLASSKGTFDDFKKDILNDFYIASLSRQVSILGRKEVLSGKGKFGIFGDGKELAQIAMAKVFQNGDFRSGYYRDQTFMMAIGALKPNHIFASVYGHADPIAEPMSSGRQMVGHFNTDTLDSKGNLLPLVETKNSYSDVSCTAAQMPRLLGLAHASKLFRKVACMQDSSLSNDGNEVAWGTIGNASTSEGLFFETLNAAGVLQVPLVISVWDDGYGISVDNSFQTVKESISKAMAGMQRNENAKGLEIIEVVGWDYPALINAYTRASNVARTEHVPVLVHVTELTQPLGHSTSGSHERYKSSERLSWEKEFDCNTTFRKWIIAQNMATESEIIALEEKAITAVREAKTSAWDAYLAPIQAEQKDAQILLQQVAQEFPDTNTLTALASSLSKKSLVYRKSIYTAVRETLFLTKGKNTQARSALADWWKNKQQETQALYSDSLYNTFENSSLNVSTIPAKYADETALVDGRVVLRDNFNALLKKHPKMLVFGEDSGKIGDVNQGLEGLQEIYGEERVADRGIREATIIGEGIGMAFRGLRPIAEIQYLDYVLYALQLMSDDLATLHYRTRGKQAAPLIIRTRGHRLEGIWHSGSPMGGLVSLLRGMYILVPRNLTQASGMYNTLLQGRDPALVIEPLNGYRLKEKQPENFGEFTVPIGVAEQLRTGTDITIVSYGSTLRLVQSAVEKLMKMDINAEVVDVQSLIPFDSTAVIGASVQKTNRLLIVDEDVPGGGSAYILSQLLAKQHIYQHLDSQPTLLTAKDHRPAYGTDGDYFSKPSVEDIVEAVYAIMHEAKPNQFPAL
ncbi:MAG: thiamine pyrophosphate-dependent enzyme [Bacteroidetes bacterium]|nr:thiamine pyrophosphate-dependent enzyme [Bacteroidota bacterium]MDA0888021.1 thiamine pyrophosphate-dependent enzyme [Bacteroidota bacterium]